MADIFEIYRREKMSPKLQKVDDLFYKNISEKLKQYQNLLENIKEETEEVKRLRQELDNLKRLVRELYEIREKKIVNLALLAAKEDIEFPDEENMSVEEKLLYKVLKNILKRSREYLIEKTSKGEYKDIEEYQKGISLSIKKLISEKAPEVKVLRILSEVPKFVGTNLKTYGPYFPEDVVILPNDIAEMLIEGKYAEEIRVKI